MLEQKPVCQPCRNLGLECSYDKNLKWQRVKSHESALAPCRYTEEWMFLHVSLPDFDPAPSPRLFLDSDSDDTENSSSEGGDPELSSLPAQSVDGLAYGSELVPSLPHNLFMTIEESRLWSYFHQRIAPSCVLNPALNPYQDVILRIAASTGSESPLFRSIMAISSSQLYILGDRDYHSSSWDYRCQALRALRLETARMEQELMDQALEAQVLATVMALVFLDVRYLSLLPCPVPFISNTLSLPRF